MAIIHSRRLYLVVRALAMSAFRPQIVVGADGISLSSMGRARYVPHGEIDDVKVKLSHPTWWRLPWWHVKIALTSGKVLRLAVGGAAGGHTEADYLEAHAIAERIWEAKVAADSAAEADVALLRRAGTPRARIAALRALGREGGGTYRTASVSTEELWRTFESSSADPEARAGAAIALRARLDEGCRERLRVVAAATAAQELRAAIERAAGDDDAALEEALAALAAEAPAAGERTARDPPPRGG